ncbi:MAG: hypothetical protein HYS18_11560 [Burkholderiales bacterium]|nr:hypothetical protein [Burkholderiales bacterium]
MANTHSVAWRTTIVDAGDGSGDAFLELPTELLARFGWKIGDIVTVTASENGCLFIGKPKVSQN